MPNGLRAGYGLALLAITLLRLAVAAATPLTPDEAYYWVWSRALAPGYYDHPPMVALFVWAGVAVAGDTSLGVRLLAPVSAALGSVLIARAGTDLSGDRRVGQWAAILLNATLGFALGGVSMTPDTPLSLFWIAAIWAAARLHVTGQGAWFLVLGGAIGLALASKLSAAFLALGIAAWVLLVPGLRPWLRTIWPCAGAGLAFGIFAPVLAWNAGHGWAGFARQGSRLGGLNIAQAPGWLAELILGQVGMLTPVIFALAAIGLARACLIAWRGRVPAATLLALLSLPAIVLFLQHTLTDRVQGNWPAIIYPAAILAAALYAAPSWRPCAATLGAAITALVYIHAVFAVLPIPPRLDPSMKRLAGWDTLAGEVDLVARAQGAAFIAAEDYAVAAMLAWQMPGVSILATQSRWSHFSLPREVPAGPGLLLRSARLQERMDGEAWREQIQVGTATRARNGVTAEDYRLYRVIPRSEAPIPRVPTARPGWSPK